MTPVETIDQVSTSEPSTPLRQSPVTSPMTATLPPTTNTTENPPEITTESVSNSGPEAGSSSSMEGAVGGSNNLKPATEPRNIPSDLVSLKEVYL